LTEFAITSPFTDDEPEIETVRLVAKRIPLNWALPLMVALPVPRTLKRTSCGLIPVPRTILALLESENWLRTLMMYDVPAVPARVNVPLLSMKLFNLSTTH